MVREDGINEYLYKQGTEMASKRKERLQAEIKRTKGMMSPHITKMAQKTKAVYMKTAKPLFKTQDLEPAKKKQPRQTSRSHRKSETNDKPAETEPKLNREQLNAFLAQKYSTLPNMQVAKKESETQTFDDKGEESSEGFYEPIEPDPVPGKHFEYDTESGGSFCYPPKTGHSFKQKGRNVQNVNEYGLNCKPDLMSYFSPEQVNNRAQYDKNFASRGVIANRNCAACSSSKNKWQAVKRTDYLQQSSLLSKTKSTKHSSL